MSLLNPIPDRFIYEAAGAATGSAPHPMLCASGDGTVIPATAPNAVKLADAIMDRIERDRDYHGAAISRDALIEVAVMLGCTKP